MAKLRAQAAGWQAPRRTLLPVSMQAPVIATAPIGAVRPTAQAPVFPAVYDAAELLKKPAPPRRWVVDQWLPHAENTLFAGDGRQGKSTLALQLAVAPTTGHHARPRLNEANFSATAKVERLKNPGKYRDGDGLYQQRRRHQDLALPLHARRQAPVDGARAYPLFGLTDARAEALDARRLRTSGLPSGSRPPRASRSGNDPVIGALPVAKIDTGLVLQCLEPNWEAKNETMSRVRGRIESILSRSTVKGYRTGDNPPYREKFCNFYWEQCMKTGWWPGHPAERR